MYNFSTPNIEPHQNICGICLLKIQPEELPLQVGLFSVIPTLLVYLAALMAMESIHRLGAP